MTDLRTRAIAALSGACFPDNEAREQTIARVVDFVERECNDILLYLHDKKERILQNADACRERGNISRSAEEQNAAIHFSSAIAAIRARRENANEKR